MQYSCIVLYTRLTNNTQKQVMKMNYSLKGKKRATAKAVLNSKNNKNNNTASFGLRQKSEQTVSVFLFNFSGDVVDVKFKKTHNKAFKISKK